MRIIHTILIGLCCLLFLVLLGIALRIQLFRTTRIYEPVSMQTEQFTVPAEPFDLDQAIQNGKAFSIPYPDDERFTILWGTDFHLRKGPFSRRKRVYALLKRAFEKTDPDLTVITGDLLYSYEALDLLKEFASFMEEQGRYWAYSFGNHDGQFTSDRKTLGTALKAYPHALFSMGEDWVRGYSDYPLVLNWNGKPTQALVLLDSHDSRRYAQGKIGPDYLYPSQIAWYRWVEDGLSVPLYAFVHIPLPEFKSLWESGTALGVKQDKQVNVSLENSGMFKAMQEKGFTQAVFCGHDHLNDFAGNWDGIDLVYGRSASYGSYGSPSFPKGVKTITLQPNSPAYTMQTYTVDQWGL